MPNLTVEIKNFSAKLINLFKKQISLLFWLILGIIFIFEFFIIQATISIILHPFGTTQTVKTTQGVRLNLNDYDIVVKRIETANSYQPEVKTLNNPFIKSGK